jgi:4-hydroxy-L-threonine phosphate dehydrogenase PdxA
MRNYLKRKLQYFINMLLIPHPKVGLGKTQVMLLFGSPFIKDRTFAVSVDRNDRSTFGRTSNEALRSLVVGVANMEKTTSAIMDFAEALQQVEFGEKEAVFLEPLMKEVLNAVRAVAKDARMRRTHRLNCLQSVLKTVGNRL